MAWESCSSRHLITCFLSSEKLHHRQEVDPRIHQSPRAQPSPAATSPPFTLGFEQALFATDSSSARWKRWTLTRPRYQRRRQPRGLASDRVAECRWILQSLSGRATPRTTDAASIRAASRRRMEPALVSSSCCCFSHLSRVGFFAVAKRLGFLGFRATIPLSAG